MATCKKCGRNIGCGCGLDANGFCAACRKIIQKIIDLC